jgi:hypothetical protein
LYWEAFSKTKGALKKAHQNILFFRIYTIKKTGKIQAHYLIKQQFRLLNNHTNYTNRTEQGRNRQTPDYRNKVRVFSAVREVSVVRGSFSGCSVSFLRLNGFSAGSIAIFTMSLVVRSEIPQAELRAA